MKVERAGRCVRTLHLSLCASLVSSRKSIGSVSKLVSLTHSVIVESSKREVVLSARRELFHVYIFATI